MVLYGSKSFGFLPIAGARDAAMGGFTSALSMDVSSVYHNPANAAMDGQLQIEFFATDSSFSLPNSWGITARKPKDSETNAAAIFFYHFWNLKDSIGLQSNQLGFCFSDDQWGITVGCTGKLLWEKWDTKDRFRTGFTCDLGTLIPISNFRFGLSAKNLLGMKCLSEAKRYEVGASFHKKFVTLSTGVSSLTNSMRTFRNEIATNWGYGCEIRILETGYFRVGRSMVLGKFVETYGIAYSTAKEGLVLSYSVRRFQGESNHFSHWISYTTSAKPEYLPIYK
ncbi:MAG: hypothetical protein N2450_01325 [bacterium]|nr:hypothetical protein [bacterium]